MSDVGVFGEFYMSCVKLWCIGKRCMCMLCVVVFFIIVSSCVVSLIYGVLAEDA